ncbi:MAG: tyrosine-type recombinase/integrase [Xenococcaceae cyanobacterium]
MYTHNQEYAKIGRVSVDVKGKSYRIRFTYPEGNRHEFSIARVSSEGWTTAIKAAQLINRDIELGDFDDTYARYSPKHARKLELARKEANKEYNLKELWEFYKEQNKNRVAKTTQKRNWSACDRYLSSTNPKLLTLDKASDFIIDLQSRYAHSTIATLFRTCLHPSINLAVKQGKIKRNPYKEIGLVKIQKKAIECFEPNEIKAIIAAFYSDEFVSKYSQYNHSWYAKYVEFLALTGCRPEEAIPLTWDDVKEQNDRMFIRFNKAYSLNILLPHTKTHEIRLFPCNEQLQELINSIPRLRYPNKLNLLFPTQEYKYIDVSNFAGKRYWKKIVYGLVEQGKVKKYLKPYCLRHSFITRLIRQGIDIATIAALVGNSTEMIVKHYLASRKDFDLPEL